MSRSPRSRANRDETGVTIIEMAVVMLIMGIAIPLITGLLISVQHQESDIQSRNAAIQEAQVISETLSRQIHAAAIPAGASSPIINATSDELEFYSSLGNVNGPTRLDIHTAPACASCTYYRLVEDLVQPGPGPTYTGTPQHQIIGTGLLPSTPSPTTDCPGGAPFVAGIFEYFNQSGSCLALDATLSPPSLDTTGSQPPEVAQVENMAITLTTVDSLNARRSPSTTVTLQLSLPNWDYTYAG